jgi:predicted AlkP superfamily pyrophosphatase or phosphodiesterase
MKFKQTLLSLAVSMVLSATTTVSANNDHKSHENNDHKPHENRDHRQHENSAIKHVLLISVDGLHQNDLDWYVANNPNSAMATMVTNGTSYNNARTPFPSDSFPGMVGQTTGGNPKSTGIYYDDAYSRSLLPFGTAKADCQNKLATPGTAVTYAENIEPLNKDGNFVLDATQGIAGLYPVAPAPDLTSVLVPGDTTSVPANILKLVSGADDVRNNLIDPAQLPVDPVSCNPVYPHQYLQVNTIFEVAHAKGLHTAWSDKHPAYEILNGPSGYGIDDLFAPEINSVINLTDPGAPDWTKNNTNTQQYDTIKVLSVLNEIKGFDHSGRNKHGTPAIFGMNFQAVSTAQKLNMSTTPESSDPTQTGGYTNDGTIPGPVLQSALHFVDESLKQMQAAIDQNANTKSNTVIILSAKHGQSPQNRSDLTLINDGDMLAALETAWSATNPSISPLVAHAMDDDGVLLWLNDRNATDFVKNFLMNYSGTGISSDAAGVKIDKSFTNAGLSQVLAGSEAASSLGLTLLDQRAPDVIGYAKIGSVYGGGKLSKIAEHGGHAVADRSVPIIVSGANIANHTVIDPVDTIQIAPTILHLLGLNTEELKAVRMEGTKVLPYLN